MEQYRNSETTDWHCLGHNKATMANKTLNHSSSIVLHTAVVGFHLSNVVLDMSLACHPLQATSRCLKFSLPQDPK